MAQSLNSSPTPATVTAPISTSTSKKKTTMQFPCVTFPCTADDKLARRSPMYMDRILSLGMAGAVLGFNLGEPRTANAAARRPPPASPTEEKKDPNVSGVLAKVLASKRRKEAMKESIANLRNKGKAID